MQCPQYVTLLGMFPNDLPFEGLGTGMAGLLEGVASAHVEEKQKHPSCSGGTDTMLLWEKTRNKMRLYPCKVVSSVFP